MLVILATAPCMGMDQSLIVSNSRHNGPKRTWEKISISSEFRSEALEEHNYEILPQVLRPWQPPTHLHPRPPFDVLHVRVESATDLYSAFCFFMAVVRSYYNVPDFILPILAAGLKI